MPGQRAAPFWWRGLHSCPSSIKTRVCRRRFDKLGCGHVGGGISKTAKRELLETLRDRYRSSSKKDKSRILDEFIAVTGHHRKHGIRLLGQLDDDEGTPRPARGQRIYDEAIGEAVIVIWEAADRICGKRLIDAKPARMLDVGQRCPTWWIPWNAMGTSLSTPRYESGCRPPVQPLSTVS